MGRFGREDEIGALILIPGLRPSYFRVGSDNRFFRCGGVSRVIVITNEMFSQLDEN